MTIEAVVLFAVSVLLVAVKFALMLADRSPARLAQPIRRPALPLRLSQRPG